MIIRHLNAFFFTLLQRGLSKVSLVLVCLTLLYACSQQKIDLTGNKATSTNSGGGETKDSDGDENDDEFQEGSTSSKVTGASLTSTTYECESERDEVNTSTELKCYAGFASDGQQGSLALTSTFVKADDIDDGLDIVWSQVRQYIDSDNGPITCHEENKGLTYICQFANDLNMAVRTLVSFSVTDSQANVLHTVTNTVAFENECDGLPSATNYDAFGDGTAARPYLWCFSAQLVDFANNQCNAGSGAGCAAHIRIGKDLDGTGVASKIGALGHPFIGHLYGNGYTIQNINLTGASDMGIFGLISSGAVLDYFTVKNSTINISAAGGVLVSSAEAGSEIRHVRVIDSTITAGGAGSYTGGIVGILSGTLKYSYSNATINSIGGYIGGLAGVVQSTGTIIESYADSDVGGTGYVGGIAGMLMGSIVDCYATGNVVGQGWGGGILGINNGAGSSMTRSYSIGSVTGSGTIGGVGGGSVNTPVATSSYWDTQTSGRNLAFGSIIGGGPQSPNIVGKTTAQMQTQSTFSGWDFNNVWQISPNSYPTLRKIQP